MFQIKLLIGNYSNYSTFLNHANIYNNLNNLLNNYEVCALFKAITLTECHLNPEEIKLMNYLYYYTDNKNIEFTNMIPNFI